MKDINVLLKEDFQLSQSEIAMLLAIGRSRYAMYCIGQRRLPQNAIVNLLQLMEALELAKGNDYEAKPVLYDHEPVSPEWLHNKWITAKFRQAEIKKRLKYLDKKRKMHTAKLEFARQLEHAPFDKPLANAVKSIRITAEKGLRSISQQELFELELELETVEMLKKRLESIIKTVRKIIETQIHK